MTHGPFASTWMTFIGDGYTETVDGGLHRDNILVFRPGNSLTKSREFLEDGVSGRSPHEGA
jgi:hypothetical protein